MAALPEVETYDAGVYQIDTTDAVIGGVDGKSNASARNLANRTKWLKARVDALNAEDTMTAHKSAADPHTGYATKAGLQGNIYNHAVAAGTADAITVTYTPAITAWVEGVSIFVKIGANNTTATPTVAASGLTAKTVVKGAGSALRKDDLVAGMVAEFKYSATLDRVILQNPDTGTSGLIASGISIVTATSALSYAIAGGLVRFNSATAIVPTLPANSSYAAGKMLKMVNNNVGLATVTCAGTDVIKVNDTTVATLVLGKGDTLELISDGAGVWYAVGGSAQLLYSTLFGVTATPGYKKIGSLIVQGLIGTTTSGVGNFTYPIAFPSRVIGVIPQLTNDTFIGAACFLSIGANNLSGGRVIAGNGAGGATAYGGGTVGYQLIAIGD
jgi:hypothetical protein